MGVNNSLLKSIQTIVDKEVESASFDKTRQAQVIGNNADGTYTVRLDGVLYNNVSSYPKSVSITEGSVVKIVMPSNQPSQMYIITPKGGGGGDHLEITQEDYDNLPTDKKQGDTVFFVTESEPEYLIMSDSVPIGAIQSYGGNVAPSGWLICDGRAISRTEYSELFYVIGTTYGSGDGSTTFNIPDLRGRVITGVGTCDGVTYNRGDKKSAGIPNLTGQFRLGWPDNSGGGIITPNGNADNNNGVFGNKHSGKARWTPATNESDDNYHASIMTFNASSSNSHYGASSTVQPNTTVTNYIIKAKQPPTENVIKGLDPQGILIDAFYPIGTEYSTTNSVFDPNVTWGGTWTKTTVSDDEIVEQGSNYIKWKSGLAECWGNKSSSEWMGSITMPIPFLNVNNYYVTATFQATSGQVQAVSTAKNTSQSFYYYCVVNHTVDWMAKGLWKTYTVPSLKYVWHRTA